MAISTKIKDDEVELLQPVKEKIAVTGLPKVKQIIRWISKQNYTKPDESVWSVYEIDEYVNSWLEQGYKLFNTHYLGENPEAYGVLYILVKE